MELEAHINEILIAGVMSCLVMDTFQRLLFITHKILPSNWEYGWTLGLAICLRAAS